MTPLPLDRYRPFPNAGYRNFLQRNLEVPIFLRALRLPKGGRVLEVGCGRGTALPVIQRILSPSSLVGLDIEVRFLFEARAKDVSGGAARLVHGDLRHLPFPNASFDTVIDFGTCYHVGGAEQALREICRVLAPRGVFATESKLAQGSETSTLICVDSRSGWRVEDASALNVGDIDGPPELTLPPLRTSRPAGTREGRTSRKSGADESSTDGISSMRPRTSSRR